MKTAKSAELRRAGVEALLAGVGKWKLGVLQLFTAIAASPGSRLGQGAVAPPMEAFVSYGDRCTDIEKQLVRFFAPRASASQVLVLSCCKRMLKSAMGLLTVPQVKFTVGELPSDRTDDGEAKASVGGSDVRGTGGFRGRMTSRHCESCC
jgi:hypothetical protein